MNNTSFESLGLIYLNCSEVPSDGRFDSLEYVLQQLNWLKELRMKINGRIEGLENVIQALSGHTALKELHLFGAQMGKEGYTNLAAMLLNPSCSLSMLGLNDQSNIDDEMANILSSGLNGNGTPKELNLLHSFGHTHKFTATGLKTIFSPLKRVTCMIDTLTLGYNHISDSALPFLVNALSNNTTIKVLILNSMENNYAVLQAVFQFLQSPSCMLESIDLTGNDFDNEKMESLTIALDSNCCLRELVLRSNRKVTPAGWQTLFQLLQHPSCGLESINIGANNLNDETVHSLPVPSPTAAD